MCALAGLASADTPQQEADKLFAEGRELLTVKKDAKAACEKFEAAIKLDATATGTMLNLGLCYETLGKYATSIRWFRKAQAAAAEGSLAEYKAAAEQHTVDIARKVPTVKFDVSVGDAEVRVDGQRVEATDWGRAEVDPGHHEVVGSAHGKKKVVQALDIKETETKTMTITFSENAVPVYIDRGKGRRRGAIILGGVGIAALAFTGIYGKIEHDAYFDKNNSTAKQDDAKTNLKYIGTGAFILGCGAITAGVILYLTAPGKEQISDGTAFVPVIGNDQYGFAYSRGF
jgi:tetratricopeptide (TPR) repeat protein